MSDRFDKDVIVSGLAIIMLICVITLIFSGKTMYMVKDIVDGKVPETECETVSVSTTAPVPTEPSIPETKETIHTEATTIPTTQPTSVPTSTPTTAPTVLKIDPDELEMLACVIYQEAGGDLHCDECRYRVADVVLNRVAHKSFPNTIYGVLTQKNQYGMLHYTGIKWPDRAKNPGEKHAVARAYRIAEDVLRGNHSELYGKGYIWQAEFVQGNSGFWCCGHYFGK